MRKPVAILVVSVVLAGTLAGFVYFTGGMPIFSHGEIIARIEHATATADGKTIAEAMHELKVTNTVWTFRSGEWWGFEGKAFARCSFADGTSQQFAWQWDSAWPHALAITPNTAKAFPLMDPKVELTTDGHSTLWAGRGGFGKYFIRRPFATDHEPLTTNH